MYNFPLYNHEMHLIQWGVVICASLVAAVIDCRSHRIPNLLTFPMLVAGLIWAMYVGGVWGGLEALAAMLALAFPYVLLFLFGGGGAGDAKLMGAIGVWLGLYYGVIVLVAVAMVGAFSGLVVAFAAKQLKPVLKRLGTAIFSLGLVFTPLRKAAFLTIMPPKQQDMLKVPYGLSIFLGVCTSAIGLYICYINT